MDDKLLAILEGDDGDIDAFNIDSDEIDFDAIPKKSDLSKGRRPGLKRPTSFDISESEKDEESSDDAFYVESEKESPKKPEKKEESDSDFFNESEKESPVPSPKKESKSFSVETPKPTKENNIEPTPIKQTPKKVQKSKSFDKMTPIEIFEHTVVNYLERSTNDATRAFIDELNFLMDQAFSCDKVITHFIEDVNNETKKIVEDAYNSPPSLSDFGTEMENLINDQFSKIKKYIPQADPNKIPQKETLSNLNFSINQALNNFMARSNITLEEESEISSLNLSFESAPDLDIRLAQLKQMKAEAEAISMEQEAEFNVLAAASRRIKEEQAAFNEREMRRFASNVTEQNSELQNEVDTLLEEIEKMNNVPTLPLLESLKSTLRTAVDASRELADANIGLVGPLAHPPPPPPGVGGWQGYFAVPPPMHYSPMRPPTISRIPRNGKSPDLIDDIRERIDNIRRESESSHVEISFL